MYVLNVIHERKIMILMVFIMVFIASTTNKQPTNTLHFISILRNTIHILVSNDMLY